MANQTANATIANAHRRARMPADAGMLAVLVGVALIFELLGWFVVGQSFVFNS